MALPPSPLTPILNTGYYKIKNRAFGAIREDEGALGAKGNSRSEELEVSHSLHGSHLCLWSDTLWQWYVSRNQDSTYTLATLAPGTQATFLRSTPATAGPPNPPGFFSNPGGVISEIEKRFYISNENSDESASWTIQPILTGDTGDKDTPAVLYVYVSYAVMMSDPLRLTPPNSIYQLPNAQCPDIGHWELNNDDKKEPVSFSCLDNLISMD
jgi:hypothetical protein